MALVQVKDETGNPLAKVKVGDTKLQALQRLGAWARAGILSNKDGLGLLDDDCITADGEPYVLKQLPLPQQQQYAYLVGVTVLGALQSNGARGNVYKFLERHNGHYSSDRGIQIQYSHDDLTVKAYFVSYDAACAFQTAMNEWEIHKELAHLAGVTIDPITPARVPMPADLERIRLQDYVAQDSESPCQTLQHLHSFRLSIPVTEPVEPSSPLMRYQSIDKVVPHVGHYKCHLIDKAKSKKYQTNENNLVAASWIFHQQLDGLNVAEGIPLVAISVKSSSQHRHAGYDNRYAVALTLEFFYTELASAFAARDGASRISDTTWETTVYVQDKETFEKCVAWKYEATAKAWNEHRAFLNQE